MRLSGEIAPHLRFRVCLPTPVAPVSAFTFTECFIEVEAHYEARLMTEIDEIVAAIPHERLAFQWDVAYEFAILEGVMGSAHLPIQRRKFLIASYASSPIACRPR